VPVERAEEARAVLLKLFPEGFEELDLGGEIELAAYTDAGGERRLRSAFGAVRASEVADGWEERWREFHRPVRVGPLWVGPPWLRPPADVTAVVVDPGRAFGTGAHPTTRLCLELLVGLPRGSLLDVVCGSGVLAMAGAKLGFAPVYALDSDPAAVEAAKRNVGANGVHVEVSVADGLAEELPQAGIAVANLTRAAVDALAAHVHAPTLVSSGYLARDTVAPSGFRRVRRRVEAGWAADVFARETE
jgi:ribosomal protein L11 methyltransferase